MRAPALYQLLLVSTLLTGLLACSGTTEDSTAGATSGSSSGGHDGDGGGAASGGASSHGGAAPGPTSSSSAGGAVPFVTAAHPAPYTVVDVGGPIMASQKVVPVFFGNDDGTTPAQIKDFLSKLQTSTYFGKAAAEYGVGATTILPPVELTEAAIGETDDDAIQQWLLDKVDAGDGVFPTPDAETIYVLFYPQGTSIEIDNFGSSCQAFGGYHANTKPDAAGLPVTYAVIPRCPGSQGFTAMDNLTDSTSHELLEAATDPLPYSNPAYDAIDDAHLYAELILLSEIGDQCSFSQTGYSTYPDMPYQVQRVYSNASALAGHSPCIPIPDGEVYFAAAPDPQDPVQIQAPDGSIATMKGTQIALGESASVDVVFFSDAPTTSWYLAAYDAQALQGKPASLEFSFSSTTGNNGDHVTLNIKAVSTPPDEGLAPYLVYSVGADGSMNVWPGFVYVP